MINAEDSMFKTPLKLKLREQNQVQASAENLPEVEARRLANPSVAAFEPRLLDIDGSDRQSLTGMDALAWQYAAAVGIC